MFQKIMCLANIHKKGEFIEKYYIDTYDQTDVWKSVGYKVYKCSCCGNYFSVKIGDLAPHELKNYKYKVYPTP